MTKAAADLIIIGGGLMGSSTAFFMARQGHKVILLESGLIGRQASGTNFGAVRRQGRPMEQMELTHRARAVWHDLPKLIGEDLEFVSKGHLRIALDEPSAIEMEAYHAEALAQGLEAELLRPQDLRERFPWLAPEVKLGTFAAGDGHANPRLAGPAFARAAKRAGAIIRENALVQSAEKVGEDFEVICADGSIYRAPQLMLSAGAWSGKFAAEFGEAVDLVIKGPQLSVTEPLPYFMEPNVSVATKTADEHIYFRQVERGNIVIGGPIWGPASTETGLAQVDPQIPLIQYAQTRRWLPLLSKVRIIRSWSGVESYTSDGNPVMGRSEKHSGLFYAYGFSGCGFQLGPGVGLTMAELIGRGDPGMSLAAFRPGRFKSAPSTWQAYGD